MKASEEQYRHTVPREIPIVRPCRWLLSAIPHHIPYQVLLAILSFVAVRTSFRQLAEASACGFAMSLRRG